MERDYKLTTQKVTDSSYKREIVAYYSTPNGRIIRIRTQSVIPLSDYATREVKPSDVHPEIINICVFSYDASGNDWRCIGRDETVPYDLPIKYENGAAALALADKLQQQSIEFLKTTFPGL